jgi:hypothetical protein
MTKTIIATLLFILPLITQTQEEGTIAERIVGSYRLISAEGHSTDGKVTLDWGPEPLGRLMMDAGGRMSIHLLNPARPLFESGDFLRPTSEELEEAFVGYFGYFRSYTIEKSAGVLTFHVEGAAYPNYIGTKQRRFFILDGDRLTLRTPPERAGGADITYVVIFERESG